MAQLKAPPELNSSGNVDDTGRRFNQPFTLHLRAMGISKKGNRQKEALFLTLAGSEALGVLNSFQ